MNGQLIFNGEVSAYQGRGNNELIGYARDGYPIYGLTAGEVDACGGLETPAGYRYVVSSDRSHLLGCYKAAPQTFVGE